MQAHRHADNLLRHLRSRPSFDQQNGFNSPFASATSAWLSLTIIHASAQLMTITEKLTHPRGHGTAEESFLLFVALACCSAALFPSGRSHVRNDRVSYIQKPGTFLSTWLRVHFRVGASFRSRAAVRPVDAAKYGLLRHTCNYASAARLRGRLTADDEHQFPYLHCVGRCDSAASRLEANALK
jgi:hypothetical protein